MGRCLYLTPSLSSYFRYRWERERKLFEVWCKCCTCRRAVNKRSALTALNGPMKLGSAPARLTDKGSHSLTIFMQAEKTQDSTKFSTNMSYNTYTNKFRDPMSILCVLASFSLIAGIKLLIKSWPRRHVSMMRWSLMSMRACLANK